jgi:hypothetical protein
MVQTDRLIAPKATNLPRFFSSQGNRGPEEVKLNRIRLSPG